MSGQRPRSLGSDSPGDCRAREKKARSAAPKRKTHESVSQTVKKVRQTPGFLPSVACGRGYPRANARSTRRGTLTVSVRGVQNRQCRPSLSILTAALAYASLYPPPAALGNATPHTPPPSVFQALRGGFLTRSDTRKCVFLFVFVSAKIQNDVTPYGVVLHTNDVAAPTMLHCVPIYAIIHRKAVILCTRFRFFLFSFWL